MKNNKIKNETRVEKSTVASKWRPTNLLEAPEPRPGFKQRWIATMVLGQETPTNVAKRMREGWQPRDIKTVSDANKLLAFANDANQKVERVLFGTVNPDPNAKIEDLTISPLFELPQTDEGMQKFINSPDTPLYPGSRPPE